MPSLAGNPRTRLTTPQVCHATPPPPPPLLEDELPTSLFGNVSWIDMDPLNPAAMATTILMIQQPVPNVYYGISAGETNFIDALLDYSIGSKQCRITLTLHGLRVPPEVFIFDPFTVITSQPFDTGLAYWHLEPHPGHTDERQARFSS